MGERAYVETVVANGSTPVPHRGYRVSAVRRGFCVNGSYYRLTGFPRHDEGFVSTALTTVSPGTPGAYGGVSDGGARIRGNVCSHRVHTRAPPWVPGYPGTTRVLCQRPLLPSHRGHPVPRNHATVSGRIECAYGNAGWMESVELALNVRQRRGVSGPALPRA